MNKVSSKAQIISNEYSICLDPLYSEWDRFTPTLEKQFPDILIEMLNCGHQLHPSDQNVSKDQGKENQTITSDAELTIEHKH